MTWHEPHQPPDRRYRGLQPTGRAPRDTALDAVQAAFAGLNAALGAALVASGRLLDRTVGGRRISVAGGWVLAASCTTLALMAHLPDLGILPARP